MSGFDVVSIRHICASYFDQRVTPLLQEVREVQKHFEARLEDLAASLEQKLGASEAAPPSEAADAATARLDDLEARITALEKIPTLALVKELEARVVEAEKALKVEDLPSLQQVSDLASRLELKADAKNVPTLAQFQRLEDEVEMKANSGDVATSSQLQRLQTTVDRKAFTSKVPTRTQFEELSALVADKVDARLVPTLAQVKELAADLKGKASLSSVASIQHINKLNSEMQGKANASDVATATAVDDLKEKVDMLVAQKVASEKALPLVEHQKFAELTERKLTFLAKELKRMPKEIQSSMGMPAHPGYDQCEPIFWFVPAHPTMMGPEGSWIPTDASMGGSSDMSSMASSVDSWQYMQQPASAHSTPSADTSADS